jgi:heptosyltransferase-3
VRLLFIKPKHIGDTLVLTPTLVAVRAAYPDAEIWVMVRRGCEGMLAGCPEIDRILTLPGVDKKDRTPCDALAQAVMMLGLLRVRFDYVFELGDGHRGRLVAACTRAQKRYSVKPATSLRGWVGRRFDGVSRHEWQVCHRVEKDFEAVAEFLPLSRPIPPLRFAPERMKPWAPAADWTDFAVMQTGTRQGFNRWPRERWRELGEHLLRRVQHLVLSCGGAPHEVEEARGLRAELGERVLITEGRADWSQLAWLLSRARLYVGPPTAAMHLAAACRCPIVALFGPTVEELWHPWQAPYRVVTTANVGGIADPNERHRAARARRIDELPVAPVIAACEATLVED